MRFLSISVAVLTLGLGLPQAQTQDQAETRSADVIIYGGTSAGIAAAVQVKRMGKSVIVIEPGRRIGGLTTGGLGQTDIGNKNVIGGISREFYQAVRQWYQDPKNWKWQKSEEYQGMGQSKTDDGEDTLWTFEPSAALAIYQRWIEENDIPVIYGERLHREGESKAVDDGTGWLVNTPGQVSKGVEMKDGRIQAILMESGKRFEGKYFLDCSYEGDLFAGAGAGFTVGREANATYDETFNGVQTTHAVYHQLVNGIDPYIEKGNPASGLLPGIDPDGPGEEGGADHRMQAYCFRMCLTDHPDNRIPFHKPDGYDELRYELLLRNFEAGFDQNSWINSGMPNRKTDTNNRNGFSTDFIGANYDYPQAGYDERAQIVQAHLTYQQGLMWTLANHPRVPETWREFYSDWGMTKDEFTEGNGWQDQLYIREARRLISDVVMNQNHCQGSLYAEDSVGMAAYTMDSHHTQRYVTQEGFVQNEGDVQKGGFSPYPISYRSIITKRDECQNLAVPVSMSSSHIAFGSIRMEPVFMILAQSAATASILALEDGEAALQDVDVAQLQERLLADKQVLTYEPPFSARSLKGRVLDDRQVNPGAPWSPSGIMGGVNGSYHHDHGGTRGPAVAIYEWNDLEPGEYEVQMSYVANNNRASNVTVHVTDDSGTRQVQVNQKKKPSVDELFEPLGHVKTTGKVSVEITNEGADGYVIIDSVRLLDKKGD